MNTISSSIRKNVIDACRSFLDERIKNLEAQLRELTSGAENDSKSSAGDKHETSRAMMQLEHENISRQLDGFLKEKNELVQLDTTTNDVITKGSLIKTNRGFIFLSVAIGKITVDSTDVMALSTRSPLGSKLLGLKKGACAEVNGMRYQIEEIY